MDPIVITTAFLHAIRLWLVTGVSTGWALDDGDSPSEVRLFDNDVAPTLGSDTTTFNEASFAGYAATPWKAQVNRTDPATGQVITGSSTVASFAPNTTLGDPVDIYGYYVTAGGNLVYACRFQETKTVFTPEDVIEILPAIGMFADAIQVAPPLP